MIRWGKRSRLGGCRRRPQQGIDGSIAQDREVEGATATLDPSLASLPVQSRATKWRDGTFGLTPTARRRRRPSLDP